MQYYRDNTKKFEEVYEKLWKPKGTYITNILAVLQFLSITMAIQKKLCLASCSFYMLLDKNEF